MHLKLDILVLFFGICMFTLSCGGSGGSTGPDGSDETDQDGDPVLMECSDGIDNDGDGLIDWQLDLVCVDSDDSTEGGQNNQLDNGWTVFEKAADTEIFYVSSSMGNDSWSGLAPDWDGTDGPKKTVAGGIALMEDGKPDWLLFKRGDTWVDEIIGNWRISGRSDMEPVIIASYGESTQRPRFEVGSSWLYTQGSGGASEQRSHVRILGVHIYMYSKAPDDPRFTGDGGSCLQWLRDGGDVLVEDIKCEYAQFNLQSEPTGTFTVRRNVFSKSYSLGSHAQNIFTSIGAPLIIEENLLNHGGWNNDFRLALWESETDYTLWAAVTNGCFGLDLPPEEHYDIDGVDLSSATSMQDVAVIIQTAINDVLGAGLVELRFTEGGSFQLRADGFPSSNDYAVTVYGGSNPGTDLDNLFNLTEQGSPESTIFNRNMYLAYGEGKTIVRKNIDANGASGGVQQRMGGINEDNLYLRNPHAVIFGSNQNLPDMYIGGVIRNNVVLGSRDIDTQVQGSGILATSTTEVRTYHDVDGHSLIRNLEIYGNIMAHNEYGTGNFKAISLGGDGIYENVNVYDNIVYDWARPVWPNPQDQRANAMVLNCNPGSSTVNVYDNILQQPGGGFLVSSSNEGAGVNLYGNTYWSTSPDSDAMWSQGWFSISHSVSMSEWLETTGERNAVAEQVQFLDPDRTIESYMESLGEIASYQAFIDKALMQSKYNWDEAYTAPAVNAYIREGFEIPGN